MLDLLEDEPIQYRTMIHLLLYTGMRRGELCGLEWKDIDSQKFLIHILRESLYLPEKGIYEETTKTLSSERVIKIPTDLLDSLNKYKAWQASERLSLGDKWHDSDRLFTAWNGKPVHPDTVTGWFHKFIVRNNLPDISIHSLRHTNATLLIASGVNIRTVSNRLGHAQTSTTGNIYAHAIRSADEAAAETLQNILSPVKKVSKSIG